MSRVKNAKMLISFKNDLFAFMSTVLECHPHACLHEGVRAPGTGVVTEGWELS